MVERQIEAEKGGGEADRGRERWWKCGGRGRER